MKKKILLIVAALALAFTVPSRAQTPTPTPPPLVIAPVSATVMQPAHGTLTAAQVQAIETALGGAGITFSGGYVANINVHLTFKLQPSGNYTVTFYPTTPTN